MCYLKVLFKTSDFANGASAVYFGMNAFYHCNILAASSRFSWCKRGSPRKWRTVRWGNSEYHALLKLKKWWCNASGGEFKTWYPSNKKHLNKTYKQLTHHLPFSCSLVSMPALYRASKWCVNFLKWLAVKALQLRPRGHSERKEKEQGNRPTWWNWIIYFVV